MAETSFESIPHIGVNFRRWAEVLTILSRYGFDEFLSHLELGEITKFLPSAKSGTHEHLTREARIRLALTEIGTTAIKLGQILSTRADLLGEPLARELEELQFNTPPTPAEQVRALIEAELSHPIGELFDAFEDEPIASASIAQVHRAQLKTGEAVVIKVQHPDIEERIRVDLAILLRLAHLAEHIPELSRYRPTVIVIEFRKTLLRELDALTELRSLEQFRQFFSDREDVVIPLPYAKYSSQRVLTMQRLEGIPLTHREDLEAAGVDLGVVARRGADLYLDMIIRFGRYHADPHPGNILVLEGDRVGLLDFGMVGQLDEQTRDDLDQLVLALLHHDAEELTEIVTRMCEVPLELDRVALRVELEDFLTTYAIQDLRHFDLGGALRDFTSLVRRYELRLPARVSMVIKVIVMLEGTSKKVSPDFNFLDLIESYRPQMIARRLSPRRQARRLRHVSHNVEQLLEVLPRSLLEAAKRIERGSFDIHLQHRRLEPSVNRVVLATMASALFLGSSILLAVALPPAISGISIAGALGVGASIVLGLRIFLAIKRSGSLDRD